MIQCQKPNYNRELKARTPKLNLFAIDSSSLAPRIAAKDFQTEGDISAFEGKFQSTKLLAMVNN